MRLPCADDLSYRHLFQTIHAARDGEIHIVGAGNQEDQESDNGKYPDLGCIAIRLEFSPQMGMQVDGSDRLEEKLLPPFLVGLCVDRVQLCAQIAPRERVHLPRHPGRLSPIPYLHVGEDHGIHLILKEVFAEEGFRTLQGTKDVEPHVGIARHLLQNTGHPKIPLAVIRECFPHGVVIAEILARHLLCDHHRGGVVQRRAAIPAQEREGEHCEKGRVGKHHVFFIESPPSTAHKNPVRLLQASHVNDVRKELLKCRAEGGGRLRPIAPRDPLDLIRVCVKSVITQFILHPRHDDKNACHADRKARNAERRIALVFQKVPKRDFHIVSEHPLTHRHSPVKYGTSPSCSP